jgi:hypothetical protein
MFEDSHYNLLSKVSFSILISPLPDCSENEIATSWMRYGYPNLSDEISKILSSILFDQVSYFILCFVEELSICQQSFDLET